jgi:hypothetical protein
MDNSQVSFFTSVLGTVLENFKYHVNRVLSLLHSKRVVWRDSLTACFIISATSFDNQSFENDEMSYSRKLVLIKQIITKFDKTKS